MYSLWIFFSEFGASGRTRVVRGIEDKYLCLAVWGSNSSSYWWKKKDPEFGDFKSKIQWLLNAFILKVQSDCFPVNRIFVEITSPLPCWQWAWWVETGCTFRSVVSGWKDVLQGGLFGTDFWVLISSTRRSVSDPFHLLPSESGIWWLHWILFLLDEFSNQFWGERRWPCFYISAALPASVCRDDSQHQN